MDDTSRPKNLALFRDLGPMGVTTPSCGIGTGLTRLLGGRSPIDRVCELTGITPSAEAVDAAYDPTKERISSSARLQN